MNFYVYLLVILNWPIRTYTREYEVTTDEEVAVQTDIRDIDPNEYASSQPNDNGHAAGSELLQKSSSKDHYSPEVKKFKADSIKRNEHIEMRAFGGTGMNAPDEEEDQNTDKETDREDEGAFEMLRQKGDSVVF